MKVVVIGSGLLGLSSAYFLSQQGHEVVVVDRGEQPALETSFANGGMLTPSQADPWNRPGILWQLLSWIGKEDSPFLLRPRAVPSLLGWGTQFLLHARRHRFENNLMKNVRLAALSLRVMKEINSLDDLIYDASNRGTLKIYSSAEMLSTITKESDVYRELGIRFQILKQEEVINLEPALGEIRNNLVGGIYYPEDTSGDAHKFCLSLVHAMESRKVTIENNCEITGISIKNGRVVHVQTRTRSIAGDAFVLAAGSYSVLLAGLIGLKLPIRPVKGYSLTCPLNGWVAGPKIPVIDDARHISATPLGDRLRVAGTAELDGYNTSLRKGRIDNMYRFLERLYPAFIPYMDRDSISAWCGLRPYSCDGVPIMGRTPCPNLFLNTGHGHLGWTMAAGSGKLVAELINGSDSVLDISPYQLDRFTR